MATSLGRCLAGQVPWPGATAGGEHRRAQEDGPPFTRPALILTGRQDASVGYLDQFDLLPHYPRATYAVLDVVGHNLQIEQPALFEALTAEWLDRVAAEA